MRLVGAAVLVGLAASAAIAAPRRADVAANGVKVSIPAGWKRVVPADAGAVADPKTLLVVGTSGVRRRASLCQIAAYRIPAGGAVVVVVGWASLRESGASKARGGRLPLRRLVRVRRPSFECFTGRGAAADVVLDRHAYQVNVLVGDRATSEVVEQALAVGRSFGLARPVAPPAALPRLPGWHVGTARVASRSCPRCVQVDSWGSTVRYRDAPNDFPHKTMAALRADDVIVQLIRSWEPSPPRWELTRRPLLIRRAGIHAGFEGNTTHGRVSLWGSSTWRKGSFVQAYVFFGSPHPRTAAVARAQRELDRTLFPQWTIRR